MLNIARLLLLAALLGMALFLGAPALHAQELPALEFVDSAPLALAVAAGKPASQVVFIRNHAAQLVVLRFSALVYDADGKPQTLEVQTEPAAPQIAGLAVQSFTLTLSLPTGAGTISGTGFLVVAAAEDTPAALSATRELALNSTVPKPFVWMLSGPLLVAVICVLVVLLCSWIKGRSPFAQMLGSAEWDFTKSWASIITLGAGFLSASLSSLLPDQVNQDHITGLAVIFAAFVIAAPVFYNVWLADGTQPKGRVGLYFLACVMTLWGVFGELYLGHIVVQAIDWTSMLDDPLIYLLRAMPAILGGVVWLYAVFTMYENVRTQVEAVAQQQAAQITNLKAELVKAVQALPSTDEKAASKFAQDLAQALQAIAPSLVAPEADTTSAPAKADAADALPTVPAPARVPML